MNRKLGIGLLIASFSLSSVNAGLASQIIAAAPIIVQPYEVQALNRQMLDRDRQNRDEEIAIQQLIEQNNKLTQTTLASQEDQGLARINQTMLSYRDALLSRDRAHIVANGERWWTSRYGDLIALTEDADNMTDYRSILNNKSDLLAQKYQMLSDLKDEMSALNEKLKGQEDSAASDQRETVINGFKTIAQQQQDKIQMLVARLGEMDQKIAHVDEIIAQKDQQIALLKDDLARMQSEAAAKDEMIQEQKSQIAVLQTVSKAAPMPSPKSMELPPIIVSGNGPQPQAVQGANPASDRIIKHQEDQIAILKTRMEELTAKLGNSSPLSDQLTQVQAEISAKDKIIRQQQNQIDVLEKQSQEHFSRTSSLLALPPIVVSSSGNQQLPVQQASPVKQEQLDLLKSELENKIIQEKKRGQEIFAKNETIRRQEHQIAVLKAQAEELSSREGFVKSQTDQLAAVSEKFKDQHALYADLQSELTGLRNRMKAQDFDLKSKEDSIHWLNEVLAAAKNKAEYYKLTSQQEHLAMEEVRGEMQDIKDDFARRFKDYDQFESAIASFKDQVGRLGMQLSQKSAQVDALTEQLKDRIAQENTINQEAAQAREDLKTQLQDKDGQIVKMRSDIQAILQAQADKEIYRRKALARVDDRVQLAKQLIDLQQQEAALLDERNSLAVTQNAVFERHSMDLESKIKGLMANHRLQTEDLQNRIQELRNELDQKEQQVDSLNTALKDKIAQEKDRNVLFMRIQDLTVQLQEKEDQIKVIDTQLQSGRQSKEEADSSRQQMAALQDKVDQLKQQLDSKTADSDKMSSLIDDYQKKLESRNNAYNAQLGQVLSYRNYQTQMEKEIADLNIQLQQKEAQVISIKKDMYDLQELARIKERDAQSKDLSLSMVQQKMTDQTIKEYQDKINGLQAASDAQAQVIRDLRAQLALAREERRGMPSSDEVEFLRTGLQKATIELKQKEAILAQTKANADEYQKEFKEQSQEFHSLKEQLQDAFEQINHKNEDLKYKNLELIRFKERATIKEGDLQDQINVLTRKLELAQKGFQNGPQIKVINEAPDKTNRNMVGDLEAQLKNANLQIKDLQTQLDRLSVIPKGSRLQEKLKQALDKIDEQGRVINILVKKLQEAGLSVDLSR